MAKQAAHRSRRGIEAELGARRPDIFTAMVEVEARAYVRDRDLPRLIALWPRELADQSPQGEFPHSLETAPGSPRRAPPGTRQPLELRPQPSPWSDECLQGRACTPQPHWARRRGAAHSGG